MKRIQEVLCIKGSKKVYNISIDRLVPTIEDVRKVLSYSDAIHAIELMLISEDCVRAHLRIGSTPPTKVSVADAPEEHKRLQTLIYEAFGETYICM